MRFGRAILMLFLIAGVAAAKEFPYDGYIDGNDDQAKTTTLPTDCSVATWYKYGDTTQADGTPFGHRRGVFPGSQAAS